VENEIEDIDAQKRRMRIEAPFREELFVEDINAGAGSGWCTRKE